MEIRPDIYSYEYTMKQFLFGLFDKNMKNVNNDIIPYNTCMARNKHIQYE